MQVLEDNRLEITTTIADGMSLRDYPDIKSDFWTERFIEEVNAVHRQSKEETEERV